MRGSGAIQRGAFAGDQAGLAACTGACTGTECRVAADAGHAADIADTRQPTAGRNTGLTAQGRLAANAETRLASDTGRTTGGKAGLAGETGLACQARLSGKTCLSGQTRLARQTRLAGKTRLACQARLAGKTGLACGADTGLSTEPCAADCGLATKTHTGLATNSAAGLPTDTDLAVADRTSNDAGLTACATTDCCAGLATDTEAGLATQANTGLTADGATNPGLASDATTETKPSAANNPGLTTHANTGLTADGATNPGLATETHAQTCLAADAKTEATADLSANGGLTTDAKAEPSAQTRLTTNANPHASTNLSADFGLKADTQTQARLSTQTHLSTEATGWLNESKARHEPAHAGLQAQAGANVGRDESGVARDNAGVLSDKRRGITSGRESRLRNEAGVSSEDRIRCRSEAELVGHRLPQTTDGVVGRERQAGHRAGCHRRELRRRDVDQPGTGHGLPRRRDERPRRLFTAKQAQDVVDKRGHLRSPSIKCVKLFADLDRPCAINAMDSDPSRNRGLIPQPVESPQGSTGSSR